MKLEELFKKIDLEFDGQNFLQNRRHIEDLVGFVLGLDWSQLKLSSAVAIDLTQQQKILEELNKMARGVPLAYITGEKYFYKSTFRVNSTVLIPRPETELLVENAVDLIGSQRLLIMDLGSGSGCIGLSIAKEKPDCQVHLLESSSSALAVSRKNGELLGLENVWYHHCQVGVDQFEALPAGEVADLIVANPPYILEGDSNVTDSVHQNEPHAALYCDQEGLLWIKSWLDWTYPRLKKGGHYIFEFGKGQETTIADFIATTDYSIIEVIEDYSNIKRFFKLQK